MKLGSWWGWLALGLGVGSGCSSTQMARAPEAGRGWTEFGTPHFLIRSDFDVTHGRALAHTLEEMRATLLALAWPGAADPRGRTDVIVFSKPTDFDRFSGMSATASGVAVARYGFERLIAFNPDQQAGVPLNAVHELAHDLSHWFLPLQPPWLAEGLAKYLEGSKLDRSAQRAEMGEMSKNSVEWLKYSRFFVASSKLFQSEAMHPTDPRESASFYATSWFLVHFLLNRHGEEFGQFQTKVMHLTPWQDAWSQAFPGLTNAALDQQLTDYARTGTFLTIGGPVVLPQFEPTERALSEAEVRGLRALLASASQKPIAKAETDEALRLDPGEINALVVRFHSLPPSAAQERSQIAERALAAHPENGLAWWLRAQVLPVGDEQRRALARAHELMPDHPGVAELRAADELRQGHPKEAIEDIRLALRRGPLVPPTLALYVTALGASGRCAEAAALAASARGLLSSGCKLSVNGQPADCAAFVQSAYAALQPACPANAG